MSATEDRWPMAKNHIRAIIFDVGRVLVRLDPDRLQKSLAHGLPLSPIEMWRAIEKDPLWKDWQEGRVSAGDWHLYLCKRFSMTLSFDQFVDAWNSTLDPTPIHPDGFFAKLSKNHCLGLLSNTDPIHVSHLERTYSFYAYFPEPVRTYSCVVGACKPDPLVFQHALKSCKVKADQAVYIDDILAFVEAAQALGMHGIVFTNPGQLRANLEQLGIMSN
jgi:glucose-1-phosphatase